MNQHRHGARAFTLTHLLFALVLLGAFALAGTRVFRLSMLTTRSSALAQERLTREEQALHTMRADVWQSRSIDAVEPARLRLTAAEGPIDWQTDPEGNLTRTAANDVRKWATLNLRFERQGPAILLSNKANVLAVLERGAK